MHIYFITLPVYYICGHNSDPLSSSHPHAQINAAAEVIYEAVDENANIIFGALVDESMSGEIAITVIATGFPTQENTRSGAGAGGREEGGGMTGKYSNRK